MRRFACVSIHWSFSKSDPYFTRATVMNKGRKVGKEQPIRLDTGFK